jgi:dTDP-4-dehydrorhamnose reductase
MKKKIKKILILGSSGKIGKDLYDLLKPGFDVGGTYLNKAGTKFGDYKLDLLDINSFEKIIGKFKPDFVINATGIASPEKCEHNKKTAYLVNYKIAENVAIICSKKKIPFFYFSSDYIFKGDKRDYLEEDIPNPINYYGITKLLGEIASREGIILRLPKIIFLNKFRDLFFREIMANNILQLDNFRIRKFLWTYDLYKVIKRIISLSIQKGVYHVCGEESLTKYELAKSFLDAEKLNRKIKPIRKKELVSRPEISIMSNKNIKKIGVKFSLMEQIFQSEKFNMQEND